MTTKKELRQYTPDEKAEALELAAQLGPSHAAKELGIPDGTISGWRAKAKRAGAGTSSGQPRAEPEATRRRAARRYTPTEKAETLEHAAAHGVTAAHEKFGVSRWTIYDWQRKLKRAVEGKGPSPTSGDDPSDAVERRDREVLATWRRHPGLGPSQVKNQLRREKGIRTSTNTVRRVMEDAGYVPPKTRRHDHDERYESVRPNHVWHLDFLHRHINRAGTFTLIVLDDCSRFVVGHGVDDAERADLVIETFTEAVERHGRPEMVLHDKGAAFWSWRGISRFTRLLDEMGIDQIATTKQSNGKLEVFNANLSKELFDPHRFYDIAEMKRRLAAHLHWYNHRRTSHALGGLLVPADRYYGRVAEVMARIEAGAAEDLDPLDLRGRVLELFKVASVDGRTEVWLMGQRILPAK